MIRRLRAWLWRIGGIGLADRRRRDADDEIASHLQLHTDDGVRAGLTREEARRRALLKLGSVEAIRETLDDGQGLPWLRALGRDIRSGFAALRRAPVFTLTIVATMAVGLGSSTAVFSLVDALMLRPPPLVRDPDRLVRLPAGNYVFFRDVVSRAETVDAAAYMPQTVTSGSGADVSEMHIECITGGYLRLLGVSPVLGRDFTTGESAPGGELTVILGYGYWTRAFGQDRGVIGRSVTIAGRTLPIIGVAPRSFRGLGQAAVDAWISLPAFPDACSLNRTNLLTSVSGYLPIIGRLRDGVSLSQAEAEAHAWPSQLPVLPKPPSMHLETVGDARWLAGNTDSQRDIRISLWLAGGTFLLLLIVAANVAGLLSIRAFDRHRELLVRLQLGATRGRLFAQLIVEQLLLIALGAIGAILVAEAAWALVMAYFPTTADEPLFTGRALVLLGGFAGVMALLLSPIPAVYALRAGRSGIIQVDRSIGRIRSRSRDALLVAQSAVALILIVGASLFATSVRNIKRNAGYDLSHVIVATVDLRRSDITQPDDRRAAFDTMLARVTRVPGVADASVATLSPLGVSGPFTVMAVPVPGQSTPLHGYVSRVSPHYFSTMGTAIIRGREFGDEDTAASPPVVIVDAEIARVMWPGEDVVGRCVSLSRPPCVTIVGISESRRMLSISESHAEMFFPLTQSSPTALPQALLVKTVGDPAGAVAAVSAAVQGIVPGLPLITVRPMEDIVDSGARSWRVGAAMFGTLGILANLLAALGIYAALMFSTHQRTSELGVRVALGATRVSIVFMTLRQALVPVLFGGAMGAVGAIGLSGSIRSLLFQVTPTDPWAFVIALVGLGTVALIGAAIPALKAANTDPVAALRTN